MLLIKIIAVRYSAGVGLRGEYDNCCADAITLSGGDTFGEL